MITLEFLQSKAGYRYSIDPFILADFISPKEGSKIIDFGTGNGIVPFLLACKTKSKIIGLEIQSSLLDHAKLNIAQKGLDKQVSLIHGDIKFSKLFLRNGYFDLVVSNPPYRKLKTGRLNPNLEKAIARHEINIKLVNLIDNAAHILNHYGKLVMIYIPERYKEVIDIMVLNGINPAKVRFVFSNKKESGPRMFLIEGKKNSKDSLKILDPLYIYDNNGDYTTEMKKIYDSFNNHYRTYGNRKIRASHKTC